jgi:hypothetical protein
MKRDKCGLIPGHLAPPPCLNLVHHAGLLVNGGMHLHLHVCKVIHLLLESPDPFHRALRLVNHITDVPLQRSVLVRVPG